MPEKDNNELVYNVAKKNENDTYIPLPVLVMQDDYDVKGKDVMYLVQTRDYRFAQFLQLIQNRSTFDLIFKVLENTFEVTEQPENDKAQENLAGFYHLMYLWAKACKDIDPNYIPETKGEQKDEFSNNDNKSRQNN